jgi:hypothetical protein
LPYILSLMFTWSAKDPVSFPVILFALFLAIVIFVLGCKFHNSIIFRSSKVRPY